MPTSRISAHILAGLTPGLSKGLQAGALGGSAFQQGEQQGMLLQSKLAQSLASSRYDNARADDLERQGQMQSPDAIFQNALLSSGVPLDSAPDVRRALATGSAGPQYDALQSDQAGPVLPQPDFMAKLGPLAKEIGAVQTALALGDKNSSNVLDGARERRLGDAILAGTADPTKVATSQYALKGSAPYAFHEYGVGNNLTGQVDAGGVAAQNFGQKRQSEIAENNAQAGAAKASAASSYASAGAANALRDQRQAITRAGPGGGADGKPPTGYRWAQGADGEARLQPIPGGPKDPSAQPEKALPEGAQKQLVGARNLQTAIDDYQKALVGWNNTKMLSPDARAGMGTAYNNMMLQAKEAYNLGVLNGPDYDILQAVVADPTNLKSAALSNDALVKQAGDLRKISKGIENQVLTSHGRPATPDAAPAAVRRFNPATGRIE